jgi:hypothetical protein
MGEKHGRWILLTKHLFHTRRVLLHAVNLRHRRLYFPSEGSRATDFYHPSNPSSSAGFEPANLGSSGKHAKFHTVVARFLIVNIQNVSRGIYIYVYGLFSSETERHFWEVSTSASYSGGSELRSRLRDRLLWLRHFVLFLSAFRQMPEKYLETGHNRLRPQSMSSFISYHHHTMLAVQDVVSTFRIVNMSVRFNA